MSRRKLPLGTKVKFNIAQDLDVGIVIIKEINIDSDDGHLHYRLEVIEGSFATMHRNPDNYELWVNDFEITPIN